MLEMKKRHKELLMRAEDVFGRSVDATLALLSYVTALSVIPSTKSSASFRAHLASEAFLQDINYEIIKNAIVTAWKKQYIKRKRHALPEITEEGKRRLFEVLPSYHENRAWDGRLHTVTYDIPEKKRKARDLLRRYLRRLGCAKLQESVWLTPYNPIDVLRTFISEKEIEGTVIVSDLGADASIGEETMEGLISRLYGLEALNTRYSEWLDDFSKKPMDFEAFVRFLAILKDDPQLPFSLLPKQWMGDKAYMRMKPLLSKMSLRSRP